MSTRSFTPLMVLAAFLVVSCDESQAIHEPDPSLGRMLDQPRGDPYGATPVFADGRVMRSPPGGTIPHHRPPIVDPAQASPVVTRALLESGRRRYEIFCAACHGILGDGVSVVATKMEIRKPPSLLEPRILAYTPDRVFTVATKGYGLMSSYAVQLSPEDRWAVAFYVQALQVSQNARVAEMPADVQGELQKVAQ